MKVLHVNTYDSGGAALACIRLHEALLQEGVESSLLTLHKSSNHIRSHYQFTDTPKRSFWDRTRTRLRLPGKMEAKQNRVERDKPPGFEWFSNPEGTADITGHQQYREADVVHLHWIARFVDYRTFFDKCKKPVIWTLHDMNPFSGGCHYPMDCEKYKKGCHVCPQLSARSSRDLAKENFLIKSRALSHFRRLNIVSPSQWLASCSQNSELFGALKHVVIRNGLDVSVFREYEMREAREKLSIPVHTKVLLFAAQCLDTYRKGPHLFIESVKSLYEKRQDFICCLVGHDDRKLVQMIPHSLPLGRMNDPGSMAQVYASADAFVLPSLQDNLPNTMIESLCCGTPVIAFDSGGTAEIIINHVNGLIAENKTAVSLARSIELFFDNLQNFDRSRISENARVEFDSRLQAAKCVELYKSIL